MLKLFSFLHFVFGIIANYSNIFTPLTTSYWQWWCLCWWELYCTVPVSDVVEFLIQDQIRLMELSSACLHSWNDRHTCRQVIFFLNPPKTFQGSCSLRPWQCWRCPWRCTSATLSPRPGWLQQHSRCRLLIRPEMQNLIIKRNPKESKDLQLTALVSVRRS